MSDPAAIVVMALIFVFGIAALSLLLVTIVPATLILESKVCELRRRRRDASAPPPSDERAA